MHARRSVRPPTPGVDHLLRPKVLIDRAKAELSQLLDPIWERNQDLDPAAFDAEGAKAVGEARAGKDQPGSHKRGR